MLNKDESRAFARPQSLAPSGNGTPSTYHFIAVLAA